MRHEGPFVIGNNAVFRAAEYNVAQHVAEGALEILCRKGGLRRAARQHGPFHHHGVITKIGH